MSAATPDTATDLPEVIQRYLRTHDAHDTDAALATFGPTASVTDDGETVRGLDEIRHWLDTAASEFTFERTLRDATSSDPEQWLVRNTITGNFPGGTVDLTYRFTLRDGLIEELIIAA